MSSSATTAAGAIPFRSNAVVSGGDLVNSLGLTLLVLALLAATAVYARRRGWLDRWIAPAGADERPRRQLSVVETLVLSRRTRLIRVRKGNQEWLLAESDGRVSVLRPGDAEQVS